jgi:glucose-6-phosphate dehydrogenase assembly protein OpcA
VAEALTVADDLWSGRDTTPTAIEEALRELIAERYREGHGFVPARVMNLVVILDRDFRGEIENRLARVGRYHPSRLITVCVEPGRRTMDAWATVAADETDEVPGHIAVGRERVEVTIGPERLGRLDSIVDPLLVSDLATMVWAPHGHAAGVDALRRLADIVLVDSQDGADVTGSLDRAAELSQAAYVVDLAWLRSTPWRERVAAAFDPPTLRSRLWDIDHVTVRHRQDSEAAGVLFCGWLASRLGWRPEALVRTGGRLTGHARARRHEVRIDLEPTDVGAPGLGGVTVQMTSGMRMSLDRGPGGLHAVRRARDGSERSWTVLGASRGESGVLGEGVRQALLRDPTYRPALDAGRKMLA